jgi:hypothetical protein
MMRPSRPKSWGLGGAEKDVNKFGFTGDFEVADHLADGGEDVFEILFGELIEGVLGHTDVSNPSYRCQLIFIG